jgi:hypothetical protein
LRVGQRGRGAAGRSVLILGLLLLVGCSGGQKTSTGRTQREADSVIGQSTVPGAPVVKKAIAAQDTARAQAAAIDSAAAQE